MVSARPQTLAWRNADHGDFADRLRLARRGSGSATLGAHGDELVARDLGRLQRGLGLCDIVGSRGGFDVIGAEQCQPRGLGGFAQCVQLRQPTDIVDERVVLTGLRCDGVDLVESEFETVRFLGQFRS